MAQGIVRRYPSLVKPVIQFCLDHDISIMQMPCPETMCEAGGLGRMPHGKAWYESKGLRETAEKIAKGQVEYMSRLIDGGFSILGLIGVELSPACAVNYLNRGLAVYRSEGIYIEELKRNMKDKGIEIPMIGISQRWHKKMLKDLESLLD